MVENKDILQHINIVDYISQFIQLTFENGEYWGLSIFTDEKTPSFSVNEEKQVFKDFSSGYGGNIIEFIIKKDNCSIKEAYQKIYDWKGVSNTYSPDPLYYKYKNIINSNQKINALQQNKQKRRKILDNAILNELVNSPIKEWASENIDIQTQKKFNVGYDSTCQNIIIPIYNHDGNLINLLLRTTNPYYKMFGLSKYIYKYKLGELDFFYGYNFNKKYIEEKKEIILVEGAKSVMKLSQWGINNVCAILTSHLSEAQFCLLIKWGYDVVFALDKDVDIFQNTEIFKLKNFVKVYTLLDRKNQLGKKDSPCDKGKEMWDELYNNKIKL